MKRTLLLLAVMAVCFTLPVTTQAQNKAPEGFTLIEDQPEGQLRIFTRSGNIVKEIVETDDTHYIITGTQDGNINIVFADDGSVYFQRPVSESYYDGWVKGTLSADGKTITVPVGQYTAYTKSFDMAVQIWMMRYDEEQEVYAIDESITDIIYTIDADGTISLQGTDDMVETDAGPLPTHVVASVNRCFGTTFSYLDFEWHGDGDYMTVYTPDDVELLTPPDGLTVQTLIATTGIMDGVEWDAYNSTMNMGFDGDDVWLQGFTDLLPEAWVKGHRDGSTITFPTGQLLGSYFNRLVYMVGARSDDQGNPVTTDIVFTDNGNGTYTSFTDMFVSSEQDDIAYIIYYMGMTLADHPDQTVDAPDDLQTEAYTLSYKEPDAYGRLKKKSATVMVGLDDSGEHVYIQGITPLLPDAYIEGTLSSQLVTFASPQFLGAYTEGGSGEYPIFFQAYDGDTGELLPEITFSYDPDTRILSAPTATIGIGINKTGLLGLQNMYNATFTPDSTTAIHDLPIDNSRFDSDGASQIENGKYFDLTGRRVSESKKGLFISNGKKKVRH